MSDKLQLVVCTLGRLILTDDKLKLIGHWFWRLVVGVIRDSLPVVEIPLKSGLSPGVLVAVHL